MPSVFSTQGSRERAWISPRPQPTDSSGGWNKYRMCSSFILFDREKRKEDGDFETWVPEDVGFYLC